MPPHTPNPKRSVQPDRPARILPADGLPATRDLPSETADGDIGQQEVQERWDRAAAKGHFGYAPGDSAAGTVAANLDPTAPPVQAITRADVEGTKEPPGDETARP